MSRYLVVCARTYTISQGFLTPILKMIATNGLTELRHTKQFPIPLSKIQNGIILGGLSSNKF
ncbi:hypothetical protein DP117_08410 [Brasilonema sp. UFV-L1]|nr:hypothetical protein [Brasilonema sp. UFV-L1]